MIVHLLLDGVADGPLGVGLDVVGTAARLVRAGAVPPPARADATRQRVLSLDGAPVRTQAGRTAAVDGPAGPGSCGAGDVLLLPGLGAATPGEVERLLARPDVAAAAALVREAVAGGALVAASCSATFVLAAAGVLDGRRATTTWWLAPAFAARFPRVRLCQARMVVADGGVFTAGSAFAHADLALAIAARTMGPAVAPMVARYLALDERASQSRYVVAEHLRTEDPALEALERFILANLDRQLALAELARAASLSPRTLARKVWNGFGTTPGRLVQRHRVALAARLLDATREPVEAIAARVGYADAAAFRRVFRRELGMSPHERRKAAAERDGRAGSAPP